MPVQPNPTPQRVFVSLSELAEDVLGLSRARVYELIARGALPHPLYDLRTRRPMFDAELQRQALAVRHTGIGIDGSAVIFYRREQRATTSSPSITSARPRRQTSTPQVSRYAELVGSLQTLGVAQANEQSVTAAMAQCFPHGIEGQDQSDVLRILFRQLRRLGSA